MAKQASISRTVRYAHVPKTPVLNASGDWEYVARPNATLLNESALKLKEVKTNADLAIGKANDADAKAVAAKVAADSKCTADEAVETVRETLFPMRDISGQSGQVTRAILGELAIEGDGYKWWFTLTYSRKIGSTTHQEKCPLNYATPEDLDDIYARLDAIEQRLGITP